MDCSTCREAQRLDGILPPCETDEGCWIPPLVPPAARALRIHGHLRRLKDLNIGSAVLSMHGATLHDLELLAAAEDELHMTEPDDPAGSDEE